VNALPDIEGYHAHLYFMDARQRTYATRLRQRIGQRFPKAVLGRVHDKAVGPHPAPMYQVAFGVDVFSSFVPWLMLVHEALSVLVHPLIGDPLPEHRDHAAWIGTPLELRLEVFERL
jgi:DOPA 4,5-dioxygenase